MSDHQPASPRRRILIMVVGVLVLLGVVGGAFVYLQTQAARELSDAIAEADRLDPEWRWQQLQAKREKLPDDRNSALIVTRAADLLPKGWPNWHDAHFPDEKEYAGRLDMQTAKWRVESSLVDLAPNVQLNEQQLVAIKGELNAAGAGVPIARQLVDYPGGLFPSGRNAVEQHSYEHTQKVRQVMRMLNLDVFSRAQAGDAEGAVASSRALANAVRSLGDEPAWVSQLVRFSGRAIACSTVERLLAQLEPNASELKLLQQFLADEEQFPAGLVCMRASRVEMDEYFARAVKGEIDKSTMDLVLPKSIWQDRLPGALQSRRAAMLTWYNAQVEMAKQPLHLQRWSATPSDDLIKPALAKLAAANQRTCAQLRSAVAAVAAERFRQVQRRWPKALAELVPDYLKSVPEDPYDGAPLRFCTRDNGVVVYSLGPDGRDAGGKLRWGPNEAMNGLDGLDFGVQLWDVSARRAPPLPVMTLKDLFFSAEQAGEIPGAPAIP